MGIILKGKEVIKQEEGYKELMDLISTQLYLAKSRNGLKWNTQIIERIPGGMAKSSIGDLMNGKAEYSILALYAVAKALNHKLVIRIEEV